MFGACVCMVAPCRLSKRDVDLGPRLLVPSCWFSGTRSPLSGQLMRQGRLLSILEGPYEDSTFFSRAEVLNPFGVTVWRIQCKPLIFSSGKFKYIHSILLLVPREP